MVLLLADAFSAAFPLARTLQCVFPYLGYNDEITVPELLMHL